MENEPSGEMKSPSDEGCRVMVMGVPVGGGFVLVGASVGRGFVLVGSSVGRGWAFINVSAICVCVGSFVDAGDDDYFF